MAIEIVDYYPSKMVIFHSKLLVYQRVTSIALVEDVLNE